MTSCITFIASENALNKSEYEKYAAEGDVVQNGYGSTGPAKEEGKKEEGKKEGEGGEVEKLKRRLEEAERELAAARQGKE